jgi:aminodeoxyfutalosine deaminase
LRFAKAIVKLLKMSAPDKLRDFALRIPKVELHVHLEGTMQPATLLRLAKRRGVELPAGDEAGLHDWFRFRDFDHFVNVYLTCSKCVKEPEDFQTLVRDFMAEQARQNVRHSEVHFTIATHVQFGRNAQEIAHALWEAMEEGEKRHGVRMRLIPDMVRDVGPKWGEVTLRWAVENRGRGVVALGLTGREAIHDNEPFRAHFRQAAQEGLHCVAHAGEHAGPASVRSALDVARAERIGHGVRSIEDPGLIAELVRRRVPLEVCVTSNVCLGVAPTVGEHPVDRLRRAGVALSINSDDPPMFNTTLSEEYFRLHEAFGYDAETLGRFALAALEQSFLPAAEKDRLGGEFRGEIAALGGEILGRPLAV